MDGEDENFYSWCGILELLLQSGANVDDPAVQKARRLCSYSTALSIVTVKIAQLSRNSRLVEAQRVGNLRSQLLGRGAKDKAWTEIAKDSRPERESTPAPWGRDSSNPIENLFKQVGIGPRLRMPITLDEARKFNSSEKGDRLITSLEKGQQVGKEEEAAQGKRKKTYPPVSLNWHNARKSLNLSSSTWESPRSRARSRSNDAVSNDPSHSSVVEIFLPKRPSTSESSGSDSELRRGRRRVRTSIASIQNTSDFEASNASGIHIDERADCADKIGNQEEDIPNHILEPLAGIPNRREMSPMKSVLGKKRPGKSKFGVQLSAMFKRQHKS